MLSTYAQIVRRQKLKAEVVAHLIDVGVFFEQVGIWTCFVLWELVMVTIAAAITLEFIYWLRSNGREDSPPVHPLTLAALVAMLGATWTYARFDVKKYRAEHGFQAWSKHMNDEWLRMSHILHFIETRYVLEKHGSREMAQVILESDPRFSRHLKAPADKSKPDRSAWNNQAFKLCYDGQTKHAYARTAHPARQRRKTAFLKRFCLFVIGFLAMISFQICLMLLCVAVVPGSGRVCILFFSCSISLLLSYFIRRDLTPTIITE